MHQYIPIYIYFGFIRMMKIGKFVLSYSLFADIFNFAISLVSQYLYRKGIDNDVFINELQRINLFIKLI